MNRGGKKRKKQVCILASLVHSNVIKVQDFYDNDPKYYYIVLELMRGGELFDQIQKKVGCSVAFASTSASKFFALMWNRSVSTV